MGIVEKGRRLRKERKEGKGRKRKGENREFPKVGLCFLHQFLEYFWSKAQGGAKLG